MLREMEGVARESAVIATTEQEMNKTEGVELMLCRRHLRQAPVWMEDSAKAAAMHTIKAALKEDPASCYICVARAAALNRIKAAGGDSIKAAADSELRARGDICVRKREAWPCAKEEGEARPMKYLWKVRDSYIKRLLTDSPLRPFRPLSEDYFERNPHHRATILSSAFVELSRVDEVDNILGQFFYAMAEMQLY